MKRLTLKSLGTAEKTITRLIERCRKDGPHYARNPKIVAQVSRTGKWLLNALAALKGTFDAAPVRPGNSSN
jgi:hypothetical protein